MNCLMERHIRKMKKLTVIVWAIMTLVFFCIIQMVIIRKPIISGNQVSYEKMILSVAYGYQVSQSFVPQYDYVEQIEIFVNALECDKSQGSLVASIFDSEKTQIYKNEVSLDEMPDYGGVTIAMDASLQSGEVYYLTLEAVGTMDNGPAIAFYPTSIAASEEEKEQILTYVDVPVGQSVLKVRFQYGAELPKTDYVVYYLFLSFVTFMILSKFPFWKREEGVML